MNAPVTQAPATCAACAAHYGDDGICDEGKPVASPHRRRAANDMAPVAIGALIWHDGPCCSACDGSGSIDTGSSRWGRPMHETCATCGVESFGEVSSRGMRCPGVRGESCADGLHAAYLTDGAFELPDGRLCCRACAAVACGYRGVDDAMDLGILTALEHEERPKRAVVRLVKR